MPGDIYPLYDSIIRIYLMIHDGDRRFFSERGMTTPRFQALHHIWMDPGLSLSDLAPRMLCTKGNATRILQGLEKMGLTTRRSHENDSRAVRLYLTKKGLALVEAISATHEFYIRERFACLSIEEQNALQKLLETLEGGLQEGLAS